MDQALHRVATAGALLARPGAIASHASAALLLGSPVLDARATPCVTVEPGSASALVGVHVHRATAVAPIYLGQLPLTPIELAAVDTAREHGRAAGLVIADAALGNSLTTRTALEAALGQRRGWPGVGTAGWVVDFADSRAESPLESISRLGMHDQALPRPEPQVEIWLDGRFIGRGDFYWDEPGVIGEADGWDKYGNDWRKFRDQKRKDEQYTRAGLVVARWDWNEAGDFAAVAARIRDAFRRGAAQPRGSRRWIARRLRPRE
jgi:hypothetical protein